MGSVPRAGQAARFEGARSDGGGGVGSRADASTPGRPAGIGAATMLLALGGCSWVSGMFGDDEGPPQEEVSVFDITVGQCFAAAAGAAARNSHPSMPCRATDRTARRHSRSSTTNRRPAWRATPSRRRDPRRLRRRECAQDFENYVGISYLDSSLFFTYLLPSARGWEQDRTDRAVVCFVTTTGAELTAR